MNHVSLPFAMALSVAASASAQIAPVTPTPVLTVEMYSYGYAPATINMAAGKPVTLRLVNRAGKGHDFTAERFFAASRLLSGSVKDGEIDLAPGQTASVTLVPAAGRYPVHCGHFFHDQLGMHGWIVVQ